MFDFFNRLLGRQPAESSAPADPSLTGVRLYWRDNGPIAYEARVFTDAASGGQRTDLPGQLLRSGLQWFWESSRYSDEYPPVDQSLPKRRAITELTAGSVAALVADIKEHSSGCPRWFNFYALESGSGVSPADTSARRAMLEGFSVNEEGPLAMVLYQEGEVDWEVVFVSHNPPTPVRELLAAWGIDQANVARTFQDRETNGIFEATFGLSQRKA